MTVHKKEDRQRPHYFGHRERLRERVLAKGATSLSDYEVIEFLLFGARPRSDVKPLAKALLQEFGSLAGVLCARPCRAPGKARSPTLRSSRRRRGGWP